MFVDFGLFEENMTCGAGQMLTLDQTNFLMLNEDSHGNAATDLIITF